MTAAAHTVLRLVIDGNSVSKQRPRFAIHYAQEHSTTSGLVVLLEEMA